MVKRFASLALITMVFVSWGATATLSNASASSSEESEFVSSHNSIRGSHGRATLPVYGDLAAIARRHSQAMASQQNLYHNPNLGNEVQGWTVVGENVGYGGSVSELMDAFMNSPEHRSNILDPDYNQFGVGVADDGSGTIWVTVVFAHRAGAPHRSTPRRTSHSHRSHQTRHDAIRAADAYGPDPLTLGSGDVQTVAILLRLNSRN